MRIYHYTKLRNFKTIWENQTLVFSNPHNTNDAYERGRIVSFGKEGCSIASRKVFFDILYSFHQISFCLDYSKEIRGYASPMMWGVYAREWNAETQQWENGVCLELELDDLILDDIKSGQVKYDIDVPIISTKGCDFTDTESIISYIENNLDTIFFTKHLHWSNENEFKFISRCRRELFIGKAIKGVYVHQGNKETYNFVKDIVPHSLIIPLLNGGINNRIITRYAAKSLDKVEMQGKLVRFDSSKTT